MLRSFHCVGAVLLAAICPSQAPTVTVHTGLALDLRAEHFGVAPLDLAAIAATADVTPGFALAVDSGGAHGTATLVVTPGQMPAVDLDVTAAASTFATNGGAMVSAAVDLRVAISVPSMVPGVVTVWICDMPSGGVPAVGVTRVDVDADGSWDVVGNPASYPNWAYVEFAREAGPNPLLLRIQHTGSVSVGPWDIGDYYSRIVVRWIPWSGPVASLTPGCGMLLREARAANGDIVFTASPPAIPGTWLLVGTVPQNLPLQLPPYCSLRLVIDGFAAWPAGDFVVPYTAMPRGFTVYAQAVQFESLARTRLSDLARLQVAQ